MMAGRSARWVPSISDKLGMIPIFLHAGAIAILRFFAYPFLAEQRKAATWYTDVALAFLRTMLRYLSPAQDVILSKPTGQAYLRYMRSMDLEPATVTLPGGCAAYWIGSQSAENVFLFLPGGGYMMAPTNSHFAWVDGCIKSCQAEGHSMSALVLEYTRSSEAPYPTQLREAAALLRYTIDTLKRDPSQIIIGGDSAGGHLATSLLSHLLHPHPSIPVLICPTPIRAIVLLSPSVATDTDNPSFHFNRKKDVLSKESRNRWVEAFKAGAPTDSYIEPARADISWWNGLGSCVSNVLIWAGGDEVMLDSIVAWGEKMKNVAEKERSFNRPVEVTLVTTPQQYHAQVVMEKLLGFKEPGKGAQAVEAWLLPRIQCKRDGPDNRMNWSAV